MRRKINPPRRQVSTSYTARPPIGGLNSRDSLDKMKEEDAIVLDNWFPSTATVDLRAGAALHAVGVGQIETLTRSSSGTYFDNSGVLQTASSDVARYTWKSSSLAAYTMPRLVIETARTNYCLYNRDLTNAAWTKTNCTATKNQIGLDNSSNACTKITATAANGKVTQAVTCSTGATLYVYMKRITGSGAVQLTVDNSNWTTVTVTSPTTWVRVSLAGAGTNPTIGIRLATNGDAVAVDFVHVEISTESFPIATTSASVTTGADTVAYQSGSSVSTVAGQVDTLISYASGASTKLLAAATGAIYDVTSPYGAGIPLGTGYGSNRWQYENMNGYAVLVNGVDSPIKYNGSTISSNTITGSGLTASNLCDVNLFKGRLFFVEKNTLNAWYLSLGAIAGAAQKLDFSQYCKLGGYLVCSATWSRDGGSGSDDFIVFITSRGEVLVYQGSDPGVASQWGLVGVFRIGAPIGTRPIFKSGADLVVICQDGFVPLSKVLPIDRVAAEQVALSDKVRNDINKAARLYSSNFGWQGVFYPRANMGVFNVPIVEGTNVQQYVINTITGAWCRFTGWNATSFAIHGEKLYFGTKYGVVCLADSGTADYQATDGITGDYVAISAKCKPAFNYFKNRGSLKHFKMARPMLTASAGTNIGYVMNTDFSDYQPAATLSTGVGSSAWNTSPWNTTSWTSGGQLISRWLSAPGTGYCGSFTMLIQSKTVTASINAITYVYEQGGIM